MYGNENKFNVYILWVPVVWKQNILHLYTCFNEIKVHFKG